MTLLDSILWEKFVGYKRAIEDDFKSRVLTLEDVDEEIMHSIPFEVSDNIRYYPHVREQLCRENPELMRPESEYEWEIYDWVLEDTGSIEEAVESVMICKLEYVIRERLYRIATERFSGPKNAVFIVRPRSVEFVGLEFEEELHPELYDDV